jgi:hypothetical protein
MAASSSAAAAATARAISQLVVSELHNGYGAVEAAADEAEAAAAVAEFSASMPVLPRLPSAMAPRGEASTAMVSAIDARLPICVEAAQRGDGALEALRAESRAADERFAAEKDRFVNTAIDGFLKLREVYRECQQGRVSLKTGLRLIEPHVAEAQLLENELRERRQQLVATGTQAAAPTITLADREPVVAKRKRDNDEEQADTSSTRSALTERTSNEGQAARSTESGARTGKRRRRWSRSDKIPTSDGSGDGTEAPEDACVVQ